MDGILNKSSSESNDNNDLTNKIFVIAATQDRTVLDPALLRPGRLDKHIFFSLPNENARYVFFFFFLKVKLFINLIKY